MPYRWVLAVFWCQRIFCKKKLGQVDGLKTQKRFVLISFTYFCPLIFFANKFSSDLLNRSYSSSTASTCSGLDKFGTCKIAVNADSISMSSSTCLQCVPIFCEHRSNKRNFLTVYCWYTRSAIFVLLAVASLAELTALAMSNWNIADRLDRNLTDVPHCQRQYNWDSIGMHHQRFSVFADTWLIP